MFWIYRKVIGGRKNDRYFQQEENAKNELKKDLEWIQKEGGVITRHMDYYNKEKGIPVYFYDGIVPTSVNEKGEEFSLMVLDTYFED